MSGICRGKCLAFLVAPTALTKKRIYSMLHACMLDEFNKKNCHIIQNGGHVLGISENKWIILIPATITMGGNTATFTFSPLGSHKGSLLEYVVLYRERSSSIEVWNVTITTTQEAVLTGLDQGLEYHAVVLVRTTLGVYRMSSEIQFSYQHLGK